MNTYTPNPDKPEPKYFYHESTKIRKNEKDIFISCFRVFVMVFSCFRDGFFAIKNATFTIKDLKRDFSTDILVISLFITIH